MIGATATGYLHWVRYRWHLGYYPWSRAAQRGSVVIVLFHSLFESREEAESGAADPQQGITVNFFEEFIESLLARGVAIRELEDAISHPQDGLTAVITFDDGYYNNVRALDVLQRLHVPATFFISTQHVQEQKSFWWDAMHREASKRGVRTGVIRRRIQELKRLRAEEIESRIIEWFGPRALVPVSACDRPMSEAELKDFARSPYVFLGNHTGNHAILVNYDAEGAGHQIEAAQRFLAGITGTAPRSIAYPNGNYDPGVVAVARSVGLEFGVTVRPGLNHAATPRPMELRRVTVWRAPGAARQGEVLASVGGRPA
jgi:peptidoglycan/xylan/chitin deacetylase (PgdA/CDA1 family)